MEKNLQELYEELVKSDSLINEYKEAQKNGTVVEFAKAHGCNTTEEEIKAFIEEKTANGKEMSDEELDAVAGGAGKQLRMIEIKCDKCGAKMSVSYDAWHMKDITINGQTRRFECPNNCGGNMIEA